MPTIDDALYAVATDTRMDVNEKLAVMRQLQQALPTDRWTLRYIVVGLVLVVSVTIAVMVAWSLLEREKISDIPQSLVALASTALGALAAYITPPRSTAGEERPVNLPDQHPANQQPGNQQAPIQNAQA